jgi:tryptophan-rich sensory protein
MKYIHRYGPLIALASSLAVNYRYPQSVDKDFEDETDLAFIPKGSTFSIWGLIYIMLILICMTQVLGKEMLNDHQSMLFIVLCAVNALWIIGWFNDRKKLCLFILVLMVCLTHDLWIGSVNNLTKYAFSIYFAWCISATILNINHIIYDCTKGEGMKHEQQLLYKYFGVLVPLGIAHIYLIWQMFKGKLPVEFTIPAVFCWSAWGLLNNDY